MPYTSGHFVEWNIDAIDRLIADRVEEDRRLEFKQVREKRPGQTGELPFESLRDLALKEIVAFANTDGGTLLVGIEEAANASGRRIATGKDPLSNCSSIADRLSRSIDDLVEPRLRGVHIRTVPVATDANDGFLVVTVPRSVSAPHAIRKNSARTAYRRAGEESKPMTMTEIQDLTLRLAREGDRIERRLAELPRYTIEGDDLRGATFLLSVAFTPLEPISVAVVDNPALEPAYLESRRILLGGSTVRSCRPWDLARERRWTVRGERREVEYRSPPTDGRIIQAGEALFEDGSGFYSFRYFASGGERLSAFGYSFDPEFALSTMRIAIQTIERIRLAAEQPEARFVVRFRMLPGGKLVLASNGVSLPDSRLQLSALPFPDYVAEPGMGPERLMQQFVTDLFHAFECEAPTLSMPSEG